MSENIVEQTTKNEQDWEARAMKAEAKIQDLKNSFSEKEEKIEESTEEDKTPSQEELISKLLDEKLKAFSQQKEETEFEQNQEQTNNMSMWGAPTWDTSGWKISLDDYVNMSETESAEYVAKNKDENGDVQFL